MAQAVNVAELPGAEHPGNIVINLLLVGHGDGSVGVGGRVGVLFLLFFLLCGRRRSHRQENRETNNKREKRAQAARSGGDRLCSHLIALPNNLKYSRKNSTRAQARVFNVRVSYWAQEAVTICRCTLR